MPEPMDKAYDPQQIEKQTYDYWMAQGVFEAEVNPAKAPYCIVIPPPNVTGVLHMGHALDETIQDLLIRWHRMCGDEALWIPGTDHAGIATQNVMEKRLAEEDLTRHDLGREEFTARVWKLKDEHHARIKEQLQRFGASVDWRRERFTLDEGLSRAVREAFVTLYEQGLIYRGARMINWCPRCQTGLSDLEVEHENRTGHLWYIRYPSPDGGPGLVVATTRPETMLGDTAVAVAPNDPRYAHLVGKTVLLPLQEREIPVVADEWVDPAFGTGAVKVTPAHDPNDAEIGERHHLPALVVIALDGRMTAEAGAAYEGMDRYEARAEVVAALEERGLLEKIEPHEHAVGQCQRCSTIVEPLVSTQWFVKMAPLAEEGLAAVADGRIKFVPSRWEKIYRDWLENIQDWCISRQLWWGHEIPVWYCPDCGEQICTREDPTVCPKCAGSRLERDPDVLDTWFSSGLWPISTLGWPEETPELQYFYPTSCLVTGYDIIYFWVARMIMMGLHLRHEVPFRTVFIHGLVRDETGRKMSKSLGNAVDPLLLIDEYGADALRFALLQLITHGQDLTYTPDRLVGARNFCNKLWNASRFVMMNLEDAAPDCPCGELDLADRWILSRHQRALQTVNEELGRYNLAQAADALYEYVWGEFCDWYVEIAKIALYGEDVARKQTVQTLLRQLLSEILATLHPLTPFITEAIWQRLAPEGGSLARQSYPQVDPTQISTEAEDLMAEAQVFIGAIRTLRSDLGMSPQTRVEVSLLAGSEEQRLRLLAQETIIRSLAGVANLHVLDLDEVAPPGTLGRVAAGARVLLHVGDAVDIEKEVARLVKRAQELEGKISGSRRKLDNADFVSRAPAAVIEGERVRLVDAEADLVRLQEQIQAMESLR
ncbi:MAG TPA: valine--tRNA ligase [Armatimonadota bacterium]|jgi:valyl-tRNA synthetase